MATYKILYWQEVPYQVKTEDSSDDYLAQFHWSEEEEREGTAQEVAEALVAELTAQATW